MNDLSRALRRLSGRYVPYLQPYWDEEEFSVVSASAKSGAIEGAREQLANSLKLRFPHSANIILTDTGKTALYVTLKMLGIESQKEVIIPSYCCASVIASVLRAGCSPVLADSGLHFNISEESVIAALSSRTGAILVPHLFGLRAASLEAIVALGRQRDIAVIEDVAQAYGLRLSNGDLAGSLGDAAIFSAGLGKPIMGPGGGWAILSRACSTRPDLEAEPIKEGRARKTDFLRRFTGPRSRRGRGEISHALRARLSARLRRPSRFDIRAWAKQECRVRTIGAVDAWLAAKQIERIDGNLNCRRQNARRWGALLAAAKIPCTTLPDEANTHAICPLLFRGEGGLRRAVRFRQILEREGVATEPCYTPLHLREHFRDFRRTDMTVVESIWPMVFAVPVRPNMLPEDWDRIEKAVARAAVQLAS
jgi:dTDP-4-amino-4,6-dideoxygalactose transaminase